MRLATFTHGGRTRVGVVVGDTVIDTASVPGVPTDLLGVLDAGQPALDRLRGLLAGDAPRIPMAEVHLEAPIRRPPKFLAIALNYAEHINETQLARPEFPKFFNKQSTCVTGPYDPIHMPRVSRSSTTRVNWAW